MGLKRAFKIIPHRDFIERVGRGEGARKSDGFPYGREFTYLTNLAGIIGKNCCVWFSISRRWTSSFWFDLAG